MIRKSTLILIISLILIQGHPFCQQKSPIKYGKVSKEDFDLSKYTFDSSSGAVVIADVGSSGFEGNTKSWFSLSFTHIKRIKILNKSGLDIAQVTIPLYIGNNGEEKLESLKASTYNLENGKVVETVLDSKSIFTDKLNKHFIEKKFTFPAVKEGSIIEFKYILVSDFIENFHSWEFQGHYPRIWSEYEVVIPELLQYVVLKQGYQPFIVDTVSFQNVHYNLSNVNGTSATDFFSYDGRAVDHKWVMKDVPPLKEEKYTSTIDNYNSKIEFQLSKINWPSGKVDNEMDNWPTAAKKLTEAEYFAIDVKKGNGWLSDDLKNITAGAGNSLEKAQKIYAYVRDNFTCTNHNRWTIEKPIKTVFKEKSGSVAEINLLLTAMLNHEHISADPVILSTRSNGFTNELYPLLDRFNYVISRAIIDSVVYMLDASHPTLGFSHLPADCYNGHARIITTPLPMPVYLDADSLQESKVTNIFITNDEAKKGVLQGTFNSQLGYEESYFVREKIKAKGEKDFFKEMQTGYSNNIKMANTSVDSLKQLDYPVAVHYDFQYDLEDDDILYFNPLIGEAYKENIFKSAERQYPVEMPFAMDEIYLLTMEIPSGYQIDEVPKSTRVSYNVEEGLFEYIIAKDASRLQLRCRIKLNKATFSPEDYNSLRDFFAYIVKKQAEQVVFKRKK
jgi:hypothetical protein